MKNLFSPFQRHEYFDGYAKGFDPQIRLTATNRSDAFLAGFQSGRFDYERLNGRISDGIPQRIVTHQILEEFQLAGMLGLDVDADGFSPGQMIAITQWYQRGQDQYQPQHMLYLTEVLEAVGIDLRASELEE